MFSSLILSQYSAHNFSSSLFVNTFFLSRLYSVCSLTHLTLRLLCSAQFSSLLDFCGSSQPFFSSLSDFYETIFSRLFNCVLSISALFVPSSNSLLCYHFLHLSYSLINVHGCMQRENWKQDHSDLNQRLILSFDDTLLAFSNFYTLR